MLTNRVNSLMHWIQQHNEECFKRNRLVRLNFFTILGQYAKKYKTACLKVPKCEIFHLFDLNDFYGTKSL